MRNLPAVGLLFVLAIPVLALAQSDFESASTDMRHNSVASDVTSIRLSIPKPTSEMLPASVPAPMPIRPSRLFQAIVKYSRRFPR